jgi:hypothetical protein
MAAVSAGAPEFPSEPGRPARDDPDAMARLRATFVDSMDGWVDDQPRLRAGLGFRPVADHGAGRHLARHVRHDGALGPRRVAAHPHPGSRGHTYAGGHVPGPEVYLQIYDWLVG